MISFTAEFLLQFSEKDKRKRYQFLQKKLDFFTHILLIFAHS